MDKRITQKISNIMDINNFIRHGNFREAEQLLLNKPFEDAKEEIIAGAFNAPELPYYGFTFYLANKYNKAFYHYFAAELLVTALVHIEGASQTAYYHTIEAMELAPRNISYKKFFLFFYKNPDVHVPDKTFYTVAKEILTKEPDYETARQVLAELEVN